MIDTHCHLNDEKYNEDRGQVIANLFSAGVNAAICVAYDFNSGSNAKKIAQENNNIYYTLGVHPDNSDEYDENKLEKQLKSIIGLANNPQQTRLVAIGEIGLDYYHNKQNKQQQISVFVSQIKLANKYKLPIVVHCRDAYGDCLQVLKQTPATCGVVFHCYSGSPEYAKELIKLGFKLSFTGSVTFKNAHNLHQVAKDLPDGSFFFETDSPYLTPEPNRGKRNEPKNVWDVAKFVANLRGQDLEALVKITDKTAKAFFKI